MAYLSALWARGLGKICLGIAAFDLVVGISFSLVSNLQTGMVIIAIALACMPVQVGVRYLVARRNVLNPKNDQAYGKRTMRLDDHTVRLSAESGIESTLPWASILHAERRGQFSLLFIGTIQHFIVPDSAFSSQSDLDDFFRLVSNHTTWKGRGPQVQ
jgi:hypothetical protein